MNYLPEIESLSRVTWDFFGTLTFKFDAQKPHQYGRALRMWHQFGRTVAAGFRGDKRRWPYLIWCLRGEHGEHTARWHYHFLLSGTPKLSVNRSSCFAMMEMWRQCGGGHPEIFVFDKRQAGVAYVTKCLDPGSHWESRKFGIAESLTLSDSFFRVMKTNSMMKDRQLAQLERQAERARQA